MQIISAHEAKALGLSRYYTGVPCRKGHVCERTVGRHDCAECLKDRQNAWNARNAEKVNAKSQKWYLENKEKAKGTRARWRAENAEKVRADVAAYQAANKERLSEASLAWRARNPDKVQASIVKYQTGNKTKILSQGRAWAARNKHKVNAKKSRRMLAKLRAVPAWADFDAIEAIYEQVRNVSAETGIPHHVDHIYPLRSKWVCGLHCEANLQVLPASVNQSKSNRIWPDMHLSMGVA